MKTKFTLLALCCFCWLTSASQEICNNALDDDEDGLVDLNDTTDCVCSAADAQLLSLIPNPSFEEYDCVPISVSELNCAAGWSQATDATSDYFREEGIWPDIIPEPVPDGSAVAGFLVTINAPIPGEAGIDYLEYIGACLNSPMLAGQSYTLQFSLAGTSWNGTVSNGVYYGPVDIVLFGSPTCPSWPIGLGLQDCPLSLPDWSVLGSVNYQSDETWQTVTITFTPTQDIQSVMIGGPCDVPADFAIDPNDPDFMMPYFLIDDLVLDNTANFSLLLAQSGSLCSDNLELEATVDTASLSLQWFNDGVAIVGENDVLLALSELGLDEGMYQVVSYLPNNACAQLSVEVVRPLPALPQLEAAPSIGCAPLSVSFSNDAAAQTDSCVWRFGEGMVSSQCDAQHVYVLPGMYDVEYTVFNEQGCRRDTTLADFIQVLEVPEVSLTISNVEQCIPFTATFTANGTAATQYEWYFVNDDEFLSSEFPTINYLFDDTAGVSGYEVIVVASQFDFCSDTTSARLFPIECGSPIITYPNVFTPNGDGENDGFFLNVTFVRTLSLTVYNRWGTVVFEKSTKDAASNNITWNGKMEGEPAADGVYYFTYQATGFAGEELEGAAYVQLLSGR